ncbi:MAG: hypothetical protein IAE79_05760 [Anaerolinea sp.]|nr:hypothetical protein [Anaerolinea sp.]
MKQKHKYGNKVGDVFTVKSPDYPAGSLPAFRGTQHGDRKARDERYAAFTVAETCAFFGVREEVFQNDVLIWQSLNCKPVGEVLI